MTIETKLKILSQQAKPYNNSNGIPKHHETDRGGQNANSAYSPSVQTDILSLSTQNRISDLNDIIKRIRGLNNSRKQTPLKLMADQQWRKNRRTLPTRTQKKVVYALYGPDHILGSGFQADPEWIAKMKAKGNEVVVKPLTTSNLKRALTIGDVVLFEGHGMQLGKDKNFSGIRGRDGLISVKDLQKMLKEEPCNGKNQVLVVGGCASTRGPVVKKALEDSLGKNRAYVGVTDSAAQTGRFKQFVEKMANNPGASVNDTVNWFNANGLQPRSPRGGGIHSLISSGMAISTGPNCDEKKLLDNRHLGIAPGLVRSGEPDIVLLDRTLYGS